MGYSAMGGAVGAGGLGQVGYQYGYIGYDAVTMNSVLALLVLLVFIIQFAGDALSKRFDNRWYFEKIILWYNNAKLSVEKALRTLCFQSHCKIKSLCSLR